MLSSFDCVGAAVVNAEAGGRLKVVNGVEWAPCRSVLRIAGYKICGKEWCWNV